MSNTTDIGAGTGKRFRLKENRKGTTKLESMKLLCISMEGKTEEDAHRLLDMLSSIGFRWGSGHELWENQCYKLILDRSCWIFLNTNDWNNALGDVEMCKRRESDRTITLDHLESLIEDFLYEHQS